MRYHESATRKRPAREQERDSKAARASKHARSEKLQRQRDRELKQYA